jgi:hypothetical protein
MMDPTPLPARRPPAVERIERFQALEPGTYWRALRAVTIPHPHWPDSEDTIGTGTVLLLLSIEYFEESPHTIVLRHHPLDGDPDGTYRLLVDPFLKDFELAMDGEEVRAQEMATVQQEIADLQTTLITGQKNPTVLGPVVQEAVENWERDRQERAAPTGPHQNPDTAPTPPAAPSHALMRPNERFETNVAATLARRPTDAQLQAMRTFAEREAVAARAKAGWITTRSKEIADKIKALTPFFAEQAAVALAHTEAVQRYADNLMRGIQSLDLYTGKGVEVETICEGEPAPPTERLTLMQRKLFMDEELAAWADVSAEFDCESIESFDRALATHPSLRDQILPTPRCAVSMAVRRHGLEYQGRSTFEAVQRNEINKQVFLLIRNGENIHRIFSCQPSHEHTPRLFPRVEELDEPFTDQLAGFLGLDASTITFADVRFTAAVAEAKNIALHYKRFLILLAGLDHRLQLFGPFYDPREALAFLTLDFQTRHFRFIADDEPSKSLGEGRAPVVEWITAQNAQLRSGSRVLCYYPALLTPRTAPACQKSMGRNDYVHTYAEPLTESETLVAYRDGRELCVDVHVRRTSWRHLEVPEFHAKVNLTQALLHPESRRHETAGFGCLCLDAVKATDLEHYVHDRESRIEHAYFVRLFKRAAQALRAEEATEVPARAYLRQALVEGRVAAADQIDTLLDESIRSWRCAERGAPLPPVEAKSKLAPILNLIYTKQHRLGDLTTRLEAHGTAKGYRPLRTALTGRDRLALYVEVPAAERDERLWPWGWVRRISLTAKTRSLAETASRLVWLETQPSVAETTLQEWDALAPWVHGTPEPFRPEALRKAADLGEQGVRQAREIFVRPEQGIPPTAFEPLRAQLQDLVRSSRNHRVPDVRLFVVIGAYVRTPNGRPPEITPIVVHEDAQRWLYHFGNATQKEAVGQAFLTIYRNREYATAELRQPFTPKLGTLHTLPERSVTMAIAYPGDLRFARSGKYQSLLPSRMDRYLTTWLAVRIKAARPAPPLPVVLAPEIFENGRVRLQALFPAGRPAKPKVPITTEDAA